MRLVCTVPSASRFATRLPNKTRPQSGAIPRTAPGPKLCPNIASINPTQHLLTSPPRSNTANRPGPQTMSEYLFNKSNATSTIRGTCVNCSANHRTCVMCDVYCCIHAGRVGKGLMHSPLYPQGAQTQKPYGHTKLSEQGKRLLKCRANPDIAHAPR